ncbi:hypothetical protein D3C71_1159070 [compost metagenome]
MDDFGFDFAADSGFDSGDFYFPIVRKGVFPELAFLLLKLSPELLQPPPLLVNQLLIQLLLVLLQLL